MFQKIGEKIMVVGVYKNSSFIPKKFAWKNRTYTIQQITLISDLRDGQVRKRIYAVICDKILYRLIFNRETEAWILDEIWCE